jgi:superfamily II DNA or RNA helicase
MYEVLHEGPENRTIMTFQGFKNDILKLAVSHGKPIEFYDCRRSLRAPVLSLAHGFWNNQEELFRQLLETGESGLLKAPTRYGKTIMMINTMRVFPRVRTVLAAPGVDLLSQLVDELKEALPGREVKGIFTGARNRNPSNDITVCSFDSLSKLNPDDVHLLLIDEPHAAVSESRAPLIATFKNARIYGYGATLKGRYDGADSLITGLIGPVHADRSFQEAVDEGAICPIKVSFVRVPFDPFLCRDRTTAYKRLLYKNDYIFSLTREIAKNKIPENWQTLVFIDQKKQADEMSEAIDDCEVAIASRLKVKERKELFAKMANNEIKRCVATSIYAQGVTFPDLRVMINAAGGSGSISSVQKPGRLAQTRPGKEQGHLIDFMFEPTHDPRDNPQESVSNENIMWTQVVNDCKSREKVYRSLGYTVEVVDSLSELELE